MNKCFTYKGFDNLDDALAYARASLEAEATYCEIMIYSPRLKYFDAPIIVQHNARGWIDVHSNHKEK